MDAPSWTNRPYILTVLDLIPLVLEDLYRADNPGFRFKFARFLELRAIKGASLILAISEHTARDVVRVLGIPRERIRVTPLGVDGRFFGSSTPEVQLEVRRALGLPVEAELLLYVGGIDPRKNIGALLSTMEGVTRARIDAGRPVPHLVLAGRIQDDRGYARLVADIARRGLTELVHLVGFVADEQLVPLYQTAQLFLFPSLYEGFGLPPLEAMAAGVPVISSNSSAMPEVLGDCGIGLSPDRTEDWIRESLALLDASADRLRHLASEGRRQAGRFTWERTGAATLEAYELFLSQGQQLHASSVEVA
jgi:glycosyltransferase involved in cell wall biosynthesis